jgi:hypothetical protein
MLRLFEASSIKLVFLFGFNTVCFTVKAQLCVNPIPTQIWSREKAEAFKAYNDSILRQDHDYNYDFNGNPITHIIREYGDTTSHTKDKFIALERNLMQLSPDKVIDSFSNYRELFVVESGMWSDPRGNSTSSYSLSKKDSTVFGRNFYKSILKGMPATIHSYSVGKRYLIIQICEEDIGNMFNRFSETVYYFKKLMK